MEDRIGQPAAPSWRWPTGRRRSGEPAPVPDTSAQRCTWGGAGRPGGCRHCRGSSSSPAPGLSSDPGTRSWGILENIRSGNLWFGNIWLGNIWFCFDLFHEMKAGPRMVNQGFLDLKVKPNNLKYFALLSWARVLYLGRSESKTGVYKLTLSCLEERKRP